MANHKYFGASAAYGGKVHLFEEYDGGSTMAVCSCPNTANGFANNRKGARVDVSYVNCASGRRIVANLRRNGHLPAA